MFATFLCIMNEDIARNVEVVVKRAYAAKIQGLNHMCLGFLLATVLKMEIAYQVIGSMT